MNKDEIKNSADMFLYKAIVDLNSGKYLLEAFSSFPSVLGGNVYERTQILSMHYDGDRRNEGKT